MKPISSRWGWVWFAALTLSGTVSGMYCPEAGRFLQQDPVGYVDGLNLYEYSSCSPIKNLDAMGTWNSDVHYSYTRDMASRTRMRDWATYVTGQADIYVDTLHNPVTLNQQELSWHFNIPYRDELIFNSGDSRYRIAEYEFGIAVNVCKSGGEDPTVVATQALTHLGAALHPAQDWAAHGTWKPILTAFHAPWHPSGSDEWGMDVNYRIESDGMLRDWDHYGGPPALLDIGLFEPGSSRKFRTKVNTLRYLQKFKDEVKNTPCYCAIYWW